MSSQTILFFFLLIFIGGFLEVLTQDQNQTQDLKLTYLKNEISKMYPNVEKSLRCIEPRIRNKRDANQTELISWVAMLDQRLSEANSWTKEKKIILVQLVLYNLKKLKTHLEEMDKKYPATVEELSQPLNECVLHSHGLLEILRIKYPDVYQKVQNQTRERVFEQLLNRNYGNNIVGGIYLNNTITPKIYLQDMNKSNLTNVDELCQQLYQCVLDGRKLLIMLSYHEDDFLLVISQMEKYLSEEGKKPLLEINLNK